MKKIKPARHRQIKEKLQDKHGGDRTKTSLYLSSKLFTNFKKACGSATPSKVLEELMADFIENNK